MPKGGKHFRGGGASKGAGKSAMKLRERTRGMLKEKMEKALNGQITEEYFSSYLYLSMASYFESINLQGFANWMRVQAQEEMIHAMKIFDFVIERGGRVVLEALNKPEKEWASPLAAFEAAYNHECHISECINNIVTLSLKENDHATNNTLQWFVAEQVEEEASADAVVQRLKLVGGDGAGLFMIDQELAKRVFTPPPAADAAP